MNSKRKSKFYKITLKNDNENSFQHVITCLMEICNHNYYQAGQCATIVHNVGECDIYVAPKEEAEEVSELLREEGLNIELLKHSKK